MGNTHSGGKSKMDHIIFEKINPAIARIKLNRPEVLNALNIRTAREIMGALREIAEDDGIRVVILSHQGRAFSAGGDLELIDHLTSRVDSFEIVRLFGTLFESVFLFKKPVIVSVNGAALGAGCNLALAGDFVIATEKSRFGQIFSNIGLVLDTGGFYILPRLVGLRKAIELALTGKVIDAGEAEKIGLISQVVSEKDLENTVMELAETLAKKAPLALTLIKKYLYLGLDRDIGSVLEYEALAQNICVLSQDLREGLRSVKEKSPPNFKGK
jgi:2-(1,2-epoxy-1,2-dihydrophenyl)acetyl-CoA isomerase